MTYIVLCIDTIVLSILFIMKYLLSIASLSLLFTVVLWCSPPSPNSYIVDDENETIRHWNVTLGADFNSFEVFEKFWFTYAKDKDYVYYQWIMVDGADPSAFIPIHSPRNFEGVKHEGLGKDNKNVYLGIDTIPNADPDTFEVLDKYHSYFKDKSYVYEKLDIFSVADTKTFESLDDAYFKDKNHVYKWTEILEWVDSWSVQKYSYRFPDFTSCWTNRSLSILIDKNHTFIDDLLEIKMLDLVDQDTFEMVWSKLFKDKNDLYRIAFKGYDEWWLEIIWETIWIDLQSFEHVDYHFYRDKFTVFSYDIASNMIQSLSWLDPESFEAIDLQYTKDENHVYYKNDILEWAAPETFERIRSSYYRDDNDIYHDDKIIYWVEASQSEIYMMRITDETSHRCVSDDRYLILCSNKFYFTPPISQKLDSLIKSKIAPHFSRQELESILDEALVWKTKDEMYTWEREAIERVFYNHILDNLDAYYK